MSRFDRRDAGSPSRGMLSPAPDWAGMVEVAGQRVAVDVRGPNPSLLLVNGIGGGRPMWGPLRRALPADVGTISYDAPGCGDSEPARGPLSVCDQARIAAGVVRAVGASQVDVLGFSFGGMVAQQLAREEPDLVRRVVLVATGCGVGSVPGTPLAYAILASPQLLRSPAYLHHVSPYVFGGRHGRRSSDLRRLGFQHRVDSSSYLGQLHAGMSWTSLPWLRELSQPTLVMTGDHDPLVPSANAQLMAGLMPDAQVHVVRGGGHLLVVDSVEQVAPVIDGFLRFAEVDDVRTDVPA
jgi:pimeloyl-ACP methyl ester carboxylesterase